jgi:hypothetical protein
MNLDEELKRHHQMQLEVFRLQVMVRLHHYICLWGASERKLGIAATKPKKALEKTGEKG